MHGSSILRNHGEYHLELIIRTSANIRSLHSRDDALALISILLLRTPRPRCTTTDGRRSGSVGWAVERKRCGSADRKPRPEASRVNGRLADCTPRSRPDKNVFVCRLHRSAVDCTANIRRASRFRNPMWSFAAIKLYFSPGANEWSRLINVTLRGIRLSF